jgi:hypothetical protein
VENRSAHKAIAAPLLVVGLEWSVSAANKYIGSFVADFPRYVASLQQQHVFLPGLSLMARFPRVFAYYAIEAETVLAFLMIAAAIIFWRRSSPFWDSLAAAAVTLSSIVAFTLYLIVGHPPFWPDRSSNGLGSGWPIEFFLFAISVALAVSIAVADPDIAPAALFGKLKALRRHRLQQ